MSTALKTSARRAKSMRKRLSPRGKSRFSPAKGRAYGDMFLYTGVPEAEREEVATHVAEEILVHLKDEIKSPQEVA